MSESVLRDNWKHLRLPFQLSLAPIFLWGYFLAQGGPNWRFLPAFFTVHFLLYPGITAFNSWYDRDEGPIGGLEHPPYLHTSLLPLSLLLQAVGLLFALPVGTAFLTIYLLFVALGVLYSHPRFRWKAHIAFSTLVVFGGQGILGFYAGWTIAKGGWTEAGSLSALLGASTAAFTTFGIYPLTQVYQLEEDRKRGDRTLCVWLGAERSLRVSQVCLLIAGACGVILAQRRFASLNMVDAAFLAAAFISLVICVEWMRRHFSRLSSGQAFRWVIRLQYSGSLLLSLYILVRWMIENLVRA
jgi:1,4-dihydroxy-2-naphthoate octaprenyltransferase